MTYAQAGGSTLFHPALHGQPLSVLFLVENSSEMSNIWPEVFEQGLTPVANAFQEASNASGPMSVIVLESFPTNNESSGMAPRQYRDCPTAFANMQFNPHPENRVSVGRITQGIELLETVKSHSQPPSLHLVVVAASPLADDQSGMPLQSDYSPWRFVSQRLAASRIQCHLVVTPEVSATSLSKLFEETLRISPSVVEQSYRTQAGIIVRLSSRRNEDMYLDQGAASTSQYQQASASRRNSYPIMDPTHTDQMNTTGTPFAEPDTSPRLVSQLQSVHGLTKKKVYGVKPAREPFLGGEIREKFAPPPLTTAMADMSASGGRVVTHSKLDRMGRLGQASPTDLHARRHNWPRRESRLSTPEADITGWGNVQPGYQQNHTAMPLAGGTHMVVDPSVAMGAQFSMDAPPTHMANTQVAMSQYVVGGMADPQWLPQSQQVQQVHHQQLALQQQQEQLQQQQQYHAGYNTQAAYFNAAPVQQSSAASYHNGVGTSPTSDMHPQRPFATTYNSYPPFPASSTSQAALPTPTVPSNASTMPPAAPAPASTLPELTLEDLTSVRPPKRNVVTNNPADNETFDFSAPFVAASKVLFEEELGSSFPEIPGLASDVPTQQLEADLAKLDSPADAGELFATRIPKQQQQQQQQQSAQAAVQPAASSLSSSSPPSSAASSSSRSASKGKAPQHSNAVMASQSQASAMHQQMQQRAMAQQMAQSHSLQYQHQQHQHQLQQLQLQHQQQQQHSLHYQQHQHLQQQQHQQQQQVQVPSAPGPSSMAYGGAGYQEGAGNMGHASFPSSSTYTNYPSSSLTGWAA